MDLLEVEADLLGVTGNLQVLRVANTFACRAVYRRGFAGKEPYFVDVLSETRAQTINDG
jgi:hypothetical protein